MTRRGRTVVYAVAACCVLLVAGFLVFAANATRSLPRMTSHADGIVVLTGGAERRIQAGLALLEQGLGDRLLISGVNRQMKPGEVLGQVGIDRRTCCVDLGYEALDTVGNAAEARDWAAYHGFKRLIVVTSSYHMPRSLNELALAMPDAELVAHPLVPKVLREGPWWLRPSAVRVLVAEYLKLVPSYLRGTLQRVLAPLEAVAIRQPAGGTRPRAAAL